MRNGLKWELVVNGKRVFEWKVTAANFILIFTFTVGWLECRVYDGKHSLAEIRNITLSWPSILIKYTYAHTPSFVVNKDWKIKENKHSLYYSMVRKVLFSAPLTRRVEAAFYSLFTSFREINTKTTWPATSHNANVSCDLMCEYACMCGGISGHDYACNKWGYMIYHIVVYNKAVVLNKWHNVKPTDEQGIPVI